MSKRPVTIPALSPEAVAFVRALVIYEDGAVLGLNKPSGLAVQGGSGVTRDLDTLLWAFATRKGRRPKLVHRLDRETSGIMIVAKTSPAAAALSAQFADRSTQKTYLARVNGIVQETDFISEIPLQRFQSNGLDLVRPSPADAPGAQTARTVFQRVSTDNQTSLVKACPTTGRMHQIRAHLAERGHPILGDTKYGGPLMVGTKAVDRLMLHALSLSFRHPETGAALTLQVEAPAGFEASDH